MSVICDDASAGASTNADAEQITDANAGHVTEAAVEQRLETDAVIDTPEPAEHLTADELSETACFWYRAASTAGDICLCVETAEPLPATNDLGRALVLGQVEQLCEAVERWLGTPLEIVPSSTAAHLYTWRVRVSRRSCDAGDTTAGSASALDVYLPAEAIYTLPVIPDELLQSVEFRWAEVSACLALAPVMLTNSECEQLLGGSVLLLPGSCNASWACQLNMFDGCVSLAASYEPESSGVTVQLPVAKAPSATPAMQTDRNAIELILAQPLTLDAGSLAGSLSDPGVALAAPLGDLLFLCMHNDRQIASGYIGPMGQGYALFVTRPDEAPQINQAN